MRAKDVMTTALITVSQSSDVAEATALMLAHHVSALPVLDANGRLAGLISEGDLMQRVLDEDKPRRSWWLGMFAGADESPKHFIKARSHRVADVMTKDVISVDENTPVGEIARLLEKHRIKRVPVVQDGALVGIVSRANLLHALSLAPRDTLREPSEDDRTIREQVAAAIKSAPLSSANLITFSVEAGRVSVSGVVKSDAEEKTVRVAVEDVPGVRSVELHLGRVPPWSYGI
ncbi:MAG: CBS domain-containing protein [Burkholderiaceae bacterium]